MGRIPRPRPTHLAAKLLSIRLRLGLSQDQMVRRLNYIESPLLRTNLSEFELGKREPPLPLLLRYARVVDVPLELLVDDALDLPEKLPRQKHNEEPLVIQCPSCNATKRQVKDGHYPAGNQRYLCRFCNRRYTPRSSPRGHPEEVRELAIRFYREGIRNFRRIGRSLGVSHQSVINWINSYEEGRRSQ